MLLLFTVVLSSIYLSQEESVSQNISDRNFIYNTYNYNEVINLTVNETTEQILNFIEDTDKYRGVPTRVHVSSNDSISEEYPLFITATQQKSVSSWELPLGAWAGRGRTARQLSHMARTLCPHDAGPNITSENRPLIQITTSNPTNISVGIKLRRVMDFYVEVDKEIKLNVTPSSPKYYYFSFDSNPWNATQYDSHGGFIPRFNYTIPKSVLLIIESDDDVCAMVSIQNNSCPVFDNEKDILYQGYHLTMTTKGGITLTQSMFPVGFYVVFIVKQSDEACTGVSETAGSSTDRRIKGFRFRVVPSISYKEYLIGALVTLAVVALISLSAFIVYVPSCKRAVESPDEEQTVRGPSTSAAADDEVPIIDRDKTDRDSDISDSEPEVGSSLPRALTVAGLSRARPTAHNRRSNRYFWSAMTVAVVYALPVVQLLSTYQQMVFQTGNQDLCYYNFLCAHPLGFLSDFNHVYSNIAYVILGLVFMVLTRVRQRDCRAENVGIPQHHGLFYSMGLALVMEGVLSACYHLCPNKMNFQFGTLADSSFMYVIAVLCMVKLYQNRHPDVNASAHSTFMLLAFIMAIGLLGIMYPTVYFWAVFTVLHLCVCCFLTLKIYYVGAIKLDGGMPLRAWSALRSRGRRALRPAYLARAVLLAVANVANWGLAAYGLYEHKKDFARHLLAILMGNTILYTLFYMAMKLVHRERIAPCAWIYFVLAHAAWFGALKLFLASKTKWSETPAMSRRHNAQCSALQFYDTHDLWHGASAAAMFFSFNMLLTIDDALRDTPRYKIPVF